MSFVKNVSVFFQAYNACQDVILDHIDFNCLEYRHDMRVNTQTQSYLKSIKKKWTCGLCKKLNNVMYKFWNILYFDRHFIMLSDI